MGPQEVATAYHCVASGMRPMVETRDGRRAPGRTVAADPAADLAIVAVELDLPARPVRVGALAVGEPVWAVGHPFGTAAEGKLDGLLAWSTSRGIVSATNDWYVQTDAPVNPGNSGGPLYDAEGRIIGVASRKIVGDGVAFYARTEKLEALRADPRPPSVLGGAYGAGLALVQDGETWALAEGWMAFRERVVLRIDAGLALSGAEHGRLAGSAFVRQRLGRGSWSTSLDLGGGLRWRGEPEPLLAARLSLRGIGFGAELVPGSWTWSLRLDLGWPGGLGVF